jgi:hypothetical protein
LSEQFRGHSFQNNLEMFVLCWLCFSLLPK